MSRKIWIGSNGNLNPIEESDFVEEREIQEMFNDNPDVIPGEDFGLDQLMVVGREATLGAGYPDLLAVSKMGDVVIIEFKNIGNTQARREVIGQLLDYGASLWQEAGEYNLFDESVAQKYFRGKYCTENKLKGKPSLEAAALEFFDFQIDSDVSNDGNMENGDDGITLATFKENLDACLKSGAFVFIVVCPEIPDTAKNIIKYANLCTNMRFYGVELEYFKHQNLDIVFPKGIAYTSAPVVKSKMHRRVITPEKFEEAVRTRGDKYWPAINKFRAQVMKFGGHFRPYSTGMGVYMNLGTGKKAAIMYFDAERESLLWVLRQERLETYVDDRPDLGYFTADVLATYNKRLETFPDSFRDETGTHDKFSRPVANVDFDTFQRFLDMLIDFYKEKIVTQTRQ